MELLKLINVNEIVAQIICFLAVFFLLRIFLWGRILTVLDSRHKRIVGELEQIDKTKSEVVQLKADFEGKLRDIDEIANGRFKEAVKRAEEEGEEIKGRALQEAKQIIAEVQDEITQAVTKTKEELKQQVVDLTLLATEKLLEQKFSVSDDRRLVKNIIDDLEKAND